MDGLKSNLTKSTDCYRFYYEYEHHSMNNSLNIVILVSLLVLLLPAIITNTFAIAVLKQKEQLKLSSNVLLLHTSISDLMFATIAIPLWVSHLVLFMFRQQDNCLHKSFAIFFGQLFPWMTFLTTSLISFDRHIAISKPYFYDLKVQGNQSLYPRVLLALWIMMICLNMSSFFVVDHLPTRYMSLLVPLMCTYSVYVHIATYLLVKRTKRKIHISRFKASLENARKRKVSQRGAKVARLTWYMVLSLFVCYLPYFGLQFACVVVEPIPPTLYATMSVSEVICGVKCIINPMLYYKSKRVVRVQVRDSIRRFTDTWSFLRSFRTFPVEDGQADDTLRAKRVVRIRSTHTIVNEDGINWIGKPIGLMRSPTI